MTKNNGLKTHRKRLYFDCEVTPNIGFFWQSGYKISIGPQNIIKERSIICICYKWEDEKETHSLNWDSKQSDKKMLQDFIKVVNEATELVGHNGDKFDLAWIRTRCLFHEIDMFPTYTTIDTLKVARSKFKFNSNKLNYIAQFLGIGSKIKTDFDLWKDIALKNDKVAMAKMIKYCKMDVVLLEKVHKKLSNHIAPKTHYGVIFGMDRGSCPECGNDDSNLLIKRGFAYSPAGTKMAVINCKVCGKYHRKTIK